MERLIIGLGGIAVILGIAVLLSADRRAIRLRVVGSAFALQAGIAVLVLYAPWGRALLAFLSGGVADLLSYAKAGTDFLFGPLATPAIGGNSFAIAALPVPFREALVLREYHGLGYREIAEVTGVPIGTVMSRLARARQHLLERLAKDGR